MMKVPLIVVVDDSEDNAKQWKKTIEKVVLQPDPYLGTIEVKTLVKEELKDTINVLESRRKERSAGKSVADRIVLDDCAIFVVDFDLLDEWRNNSSLPLEVTGETLAYLARCYSECGYIVALNQAVSESTFDLTLRGRPESFADLNIPSEFLGYPGLWRGFPKTSDDLHFRPWYWPILPKAAEEYEACVDLCSNAKGGNILSSTGLGEEDFTVFPYKVAEFLGTPNVEFRGDAELMSMDPKQIAGNAVGLVRLKDRETIGDANICRIAAARIRTWLHWVVLPAQNPISDLPHAVVRVPVVLKDAGSSEVLRSTIHSELESIDTNIFNEAVHIHDYLFKSDCTKWWPVPVVNWRRLLDDPAVMELQMKDAQPSRFAFCEDLSSFLPRDQARPFRSDVLSAYQSRFVSNQDNLDSALAESLRQIRYSPATRLSL